MNSIELNKKVELEIARTSEAATYLWEREWAERNGGNISLNITDIVGELPSNFEGFRYAQQSGFPAESAGTVYFVSGTGERLRELTSPEVAGCIIRIDDKAQGFHILWGGDNRPDFRPTSEFISHLKIHLDKVASGSDHRAVIHTHPIEMICLSHKAEFHRDEEAYNFAMWQMITEVRFFVPKGVGLIPYTMPGSEELADLTVETLRKRDIALWSKHGVVATGKDALEAFDFIDVANKGVKMYMQCLTSGYEPVGLTKEEMDGLF